MAIMHFLIFHPLPLLLLQIFFSSAYNPPDKYFLNCGSETVTELRNNRRFIGDTKAGGWSIYPGKSKVVKNETIPNSENEIYKTARVYKKPTWYVFGNINPNGTYMVRLHFFPTLPKIMCEAKFNVSASCGFQLLSNFSIGNDLKTAVVKEFTFEIEEEAFGIKFSPMESSLAFVNAIELFLVPNDIKPEWAYPISPEVRMNGSKYMLDSQAFQSAYRVWMGHWEITPDHDTLWRTWIPDSEFMASQSIATTFIYNKRLNYDAVGAIYVAPSYVYSIAKTLDMDTATRSRDLNLTWGFKVKKKSKYFLRLLWCNIFPNSTTFNFNIFIGVNQTSLRNTEVTTGNLSGLPFWYEFIIATDSSGVFNVGIAVNKEDPLSRVFLNGIEIMELIDKSYVGVVDLRIEEDKQRPKMIIVGVCVGGVVIIIALIIGLAMFCFTEDQKSKEHSPLLVPQNDPSSEKIMSIADLAPNLNLELKIPFGVINDATDGFDDKKIIGIGGFGNVYVGKIGEKEVAVKRSQPGHGQGMKEFQTELTIFSQIRHRFLVSLYGYCDENQEMILVYEYMEGGNLRDYLYGSKAKDRVPLSWKKRLEICIDAAKGLDYLHTGSIAGIIIHRDIKTTNILLDRDLNAKVADFGISKIREPDAAEFDDTIRGTYGYMDPEYLNTGKLKEKFDVYSFGVVLFEVLSARAPIKKSVLSEETYLADWAILCKNKGEIEKVIDPLLVGTIKANSLRKFVDVAEKCVEEVGANRPSMHDVVHDLELALQSQLMTVGQGMGYEGISTTIVEDLRKIDSRTFDQIPSKRIGDSIMLDENTTTVNASELAVEFKIDYAR